MNSSDKPKWQFDTAGTNPGCSHVKKNYKFCEEPIGQSDKLLLVFASTVILGFSLPEIHAQDFSSLLDMYVFRNGASSSARVGATFAVP
jgi:hypothetical protein